jgi:hypothetical protein
VCPVPLRRGQPALRKVPPLILYSTCFVARVRGQAYLARAERLDFGVWRVEVFGIQGCWVLSDTKDNATDAALELANNLTTTTPEVPRRRRHA